MKRVVLALALALALSACGVEAPPDSARQARGPIVIWYSNNADEVAWGEATVKAWNAAHPKEPVTAQEIPAAKSSEEVINAAIAGGSTPCLIFNTSPIAAPQFVKQGGLVALSDFPGADEYIESRVGETAEQYRGLDGRFYQMPWKANPVMIFYNKELFEKAGIDTENPPLGTYAEFLSTARQLVDSGAAPKAIWPSPRSEFYESFFDFYPFFAAETRGEPLIENGRAQFGGEAGITVADFWREVYSEDLSAPEPYQGDAFADGQAAMATVGPWAIAAYGEPVDWGVAPVPTSKGIPADETWTFSDAKSVGLYSSCDNQLSAWEFLKFATSEEVDGQLLEATGQMPLRTGLLERYAAYFKKNPGYRPFAEQAERVVEAPVTNNSIGAWQTFRDTWLRSVVFGQEAPESALPEAADRVDEIVADK